MSLHHRPQAHDDKCREWMDEGVNTPEEAEGRDWALKKFDDSHRGKLDA